MKRERGRGGEWSLVRLSDVAEVNPRRPAVLRDDDEETTFVPMAAVDASHGSIAAPERRPYSAVKKGYTYFAEGDVLFAKITPCMQNGKHAIARCTIGGFGFASTEFHVVRCGPRLLPEWLHSYLRQPVVLREAKRHFTGAVGQQRVPRAFLENLELPLAFIDEQRRVITVLNGSLAIVEKARAAAEARLEAARALPAAVLKGIFGNGSASRRRPAALGDVLTLRKEIIHPRDNPRGPAAFVGLQHVESNTGRRLGADNVEMSELTGRKPRFHKGDIVYGYLRPYLNKVWVAEFSGLCSVDQYVYEVDAERARTAYVAWYMRSPAYLARSRIAKVPGWLPRIRVEEVAAVELELPGLDEQDAIVREIQAAMANANGAVAGLAAEVQAISALPASLLRRAFEGGL